MVDSKKRTLKDWFFAMRPWSFPASLIPVLAVGVYVFAKSRQLDIGFNWLNFLLAIPMMIFFQASGNLISDYFDYKSQVDLNNSLNGVRHIQSGKFTPKEILMFGYSLLVVALMIGIIILNNSSWSYFYLGVVALALVVLYPVLKYRALGEVNIFLGYALLPSIGMSLVCTSYLFKEVCLICIPFGLLTVAILHANNTRDIQNDTRARIKTFAILIGFKNSALLYIAQVMGAYVLIIVFVVIGLVSPFALLTFLTLPLSFANIRQMYNNTSQSDLAIASLDQATAKTQLLFGLLYTIGFLLSCL